MMTDGKHVAKLFDVDFCVTKAGTPAVSFVWETDDGERLSYVMALTDSTGRPNHFGIQLTRRWAMAWNGCDLSWFKENREKLLGTRALLTVRDGMIEWVTPVANATGEVEKRGGGGLWNGSSGSEEVGHLLPTTGQHYENAAGEVEKRGGGGQWNGSSDSADQPNGDEVSHLVKNDGDHHCQPQPSTSTFSRKIPIKLVVDPAKLEEMPERIEPTFEEAKTLFDAITEGTNKLDADKVWTIMAKKIGPMQIDFGEAEWQQMIDRIKQLKSWSGYVDV